MRPELSIISLLSFVPSVFGHGVITSPPPRVVGPAMAAACGQQLFNNQAADNEGNIQGQLQVAVSQKDYNPTKCNVWLCKGYQFADNSANVQSFTPGQVIDMTIKIGAPHTGEANVTIVDTKANAVIGSELIYFSDYASNAHPIPANNTNFQITMPSNLGSQCATAGDCVIQWYWNAPSIKQTYESCVDFTMSGSGAAPPAASAPVSSAPASSPAADPCA